MTDTLILTEDQGRATEIEFLNGEILRRAHTLGIAAPINQALTVMVRLAEQRQA